MLSNLKLSYKKNIVLIYLATLIISRIPIPQWNLQMKLASLADAVLKTEDHIHELLRLVWTN